MRLPRQAPARRGVHRDVATPLGIPLFNNSVREQHESGQGERVLRVQAQAEEEAGTVQVREGQWRAPVLQVHDGAEAQAAQEEQEGGAREAEGADARAAAQAVADQVRELVGGRREQFGGGERVLVLGGVKGKESFQADVEGVVQKEVEKVVEEVVEEGVSGFV